MAIPTTKVSIPKVQTQDRNINQLQQNIIDAFNRLQVQSFNAGTAVGESKAAYLTESQFQAQAGTNWVLQDGRSCVGSTYESITGNKNVPDACGRVLRMADNGKGINPDGNLPIGSNQNDQFASHTHIQDSHTHGYATLRGGLQNGGGAPFNANDSSLGAGGTTTTGTVATNQNTGGNETRMKNTTVNLFIRIN